MYSSVAVDFVCVVVLSWLLWNVALVWLISVVSICDAVIVTLLGLLMSVGVVGEVICGIVCEVVDIGGLWGGCLWMMS